MGEAKRSRLSPQSRPVFKTTQAKLYDYEFFMPGRLNNQERAACGQCLPHQDEFEMAADALKMSVVRIDGIWDGKPVVMYGSEKYLNLPPDLRIPNEIASMALLAYWESRNISREQIVRQMMLMGPILVRHIRTVIKITICHDRSDIFAQQLGNLACLRLQTTTPALEKKLELYAGSSEDVDAVREAFDNFQALAMAA